jgi:hypothetical protein
MAYSGGLTSWAAKRYPATFRHFSQQNRQFATSAAHSSAHQSAQSPSRDGSIPPKSFMPCIAYRNTSF